MASVAVTISTRKTWITFGDTPTKFETCIKRVLQMKFLLVKKGY